MDPDIDEVLRKEISRQGAKLAKIGDTREPSLRVDTAAYKVIGAAIEVHRHLGPGFLEAVYERALQIELQHRGISFESQVSIPILYKGHEIAEHRLDLVVEGELVIELKAVAHLDPSHTAQVLSYLRAGCFELGLLINFSVPKLKQGVRRIVSSG